MTDDLNDPRKKERSPSFPFISLPRAVERARAVYEKYRREPARVLVVGAAWGLGAKSSGLQQTVAALKQYGLMEDSGAREDRKVTLTPLAVRILIDTRPGQREDGLREAATKPRLFAEYAHWTRHRLPDDHIISELRFERGFTEEAAKTFLRVFYETVQFSGIGEGEDPAELDGTETGSPPLESAVTTEPQQAYRPPPAAPEIARPAIELSAAGPLSSRLKVELTVGALRVSALVRTPSEADTLIQFIQANKALLSELPDVL